MPLAKETAQWWFPTSCGCVFQYGLYRDGEDWGTAAAVLEELIERCANHAHIDGMEAVEARVAAENEALSTAYGIFLEDRGLAEIPAALNYDGMTHWSIFVEEDDTPVMRVAMRGLSGAAQSKIDMVPLVDPTFDSPPVWEMEDIPLSTVAIPSWGTATKQKVIQGAHRSYGYNFGQDEQFSEFFNVVGNGDLVTRYASRFPEDFGVDATYHASKHVVDFAGSVARFTVKVDGNNRANPISHRFRVNNIDTAQWTLVPPKRYGVFVNVGAAVAFDAGDSLVGYRFSEDTAEPGEDYICNIRATHCEIEPESGRRTIFRTPGSDGTVLVNNGVPPPAFSSFSFGGNMDHYRSLITLEQSSTLDESELPLSLLVRAPGTLSGMQAAWEPAEQSAIIGLRRNGDPIDWNDPPFPHIPITAAESPLGTLKFHQNSEDTAVVASGDIVGFVGFELPVGEEIGVALHGIGINWSGAAGSLVIDHVVPESWVDSYDNVDGDRLDKFQFNKSVDEEDGNNATREWFASLIGSFHPYAPSQVRRLPLHWRDIEVVASFPIRFQNIRGFLDKNDPEDEVGPIRVSLGIGGGGHGDLGAEVGDPAFAVTDRDGWYEDEFNTHDVVSGRGVSLRFNVPLALDEQFAKAHISMVAFSYRNAPASREPLDRQLPDAVPVTPEPCLTHRAKCVKIIRTDGEIFAFTEHDNDIVYGGDTYRSRRGFVGSASELGSVIGDVGNMEIAGFTSAGGITKEDLFGGKFDGARVEVRLIPWGPYQDTENVIDLAGGVVGVVEQNVPAFRMEALSLSAYLKQRALVQVYAPTCRFQLGDSRCTVDLASLAVTGSVTALTEETAHSEIAIRRRFKDSSRPEPTGYFDEGEIEFLTGANAGQISKVKSYVLDDELVLWEPLIYPIALTDTYRMTPGCDKIGATCKEKFDNYVNFGGFEDVPGSDATLQTPTGRMGS